MEPISADGKGRLLSVEPPLPNGAIGRGFCRFAVPKADGGGANSGHFPAQQSSR
jgi:hypothetical protein